MSEGSREIFDQTLEEWVSFKQANCLNDRKHAGAVSKHFYVIKNACTYCAVEIFFLISGNLFINKNNNMKFCTGTCLQSPFNWTECLQLDLSGL